MLLQFRRVSFTYPQAASPALTHVSFQVAAGEFVLLAGPSGSGKSTLLRCINGLVPHFTGGALSGQVCVAGLDACQAGPQRLSRQVGFVFQDPEAQGVLSRVEAEVAFGLENAGLSPDTMRRRVAATLAALDLTALRERRLSQLSGGERQRVALAGALALQPLILVLDEPTSQLDPISAESLLSTLVHLNTHFGLTIVLAEHRLERVLPYVDRCLYLEAGRLVLDAPARAALEQLPHVPPVTELGRRLGWRPLPLTVAEAQGRLQLPASPAAAPRPAADGPPLVDVCQVYHAYPGRPTLKGVSLQVRPGEIVALLGHNGAGKTTLLRLIVGLLQPSQGAVLVGGRNTAGRAVADICRQVAYLPQNPDDLLFAETVSEELATTLRYHALEARPAEVAALLAELGLARYAQTYPRDLSVGERQRAALGAVLVTQPPLVLLDEPTRGLDTERKQALLALWRRWAASGRGILLVTHDVELAAQAADRAVILQAGEVVAAGDSAEILSASLEFAPQIARLFPGRGWLTVADVLAAQTATH